ncbi:MAG: hypothetical protein KGL46_05570 [Hyphomicrobiales bacterium]|nr:hypothetical protein [Hyphomicrobiales bacterium]
MPGTGAPFRNDYPAQVYPQEYRPPEYLAYLEKAAAAIKTVRIVVYAGLASFMLLAAYGFFLIYLLTSDARTMAAQTRVLADQMHDVVSAMNMMNATMGDMRANIGDMRGDMGAMRAAMDTMSRHVATIDSSAASMANTVTLIQHSARNLDSSFGPAMGMFNNFMPFRSGPVAPPFAPPPQ